jgi:hypothetical protein
MAGVICQWSPIPAAAVQRIHRNNTFDSGSRIVRIDNVPILFMSSVKDRWVKPHHMKKLHAICPSNDKRWQEFPLSGHSDNKDTADYWPNVDVWIRRILANNPPRTIRFSIVNLPPPPYPTRSSHSQPRLRTISHAVSTLSSLDPVNDREDVLQWIHEREPFEQAPVDEDELLRRVDFDKSWDEQMARRDEPNASQFEKLRRLKSDISDIRANLKSGGLVESASAVAEVLVECGFQESEVAHLGEWNREAAEMLWKERVMEHEATDYTMADVTMYIVTAKGNRTLSTQAFVQNLSAIIPTSIQADLIIIW